MNEIRAKKLFQKRTFLQNYVWEQYRVYKENMLQMEASNDQLIQSIFEEKERRAKLIEQYSKRISILEAKLRKLQDAKNKFEQFKIERPYKFQIDFQNDIEELEQEQQELDLRASEMFKKFQNPELYFYQNTNQEKNIPNDTNDMVKKIQLIIPEEEEEFYSNPESENTINYDSNGQEKQNEEEENQELKEPLFSFEEEDNQSESVVSTGSNPYQAWVPPS